MRCCSVSFRSEVLTSSLNDFHDSTNAPGPACRDSEPRGRPDAVQKHPLVATHHSCWTGKQPPDRLPGAAQIARTPRPDCCRGFQRVRKAGRCIEQFELVPHLAFDTGRAPANSRPDGRSDLLVKRSGSAAGSPVRWCVDCYGHLAVASRTRTSGAVAESKVQLRIVHSLPQESVASKDHLRGPRACVSCPVWPEAVRCRLGGGAQLGRLRLIPELELSRTTGTIPPIPSGSRVMRDHIALIFCVSSV